MIDPVVFVLKGYPRLSETFIAEEIASLEQAGLPIRIVAMRHPTDGKAHPVHRSIRAPISYLPEYLHHQPGRVFASAWRIRRTPGLFSVLRQFALDFLRDRSRNRIRRLGQAMVLAAELPDDVFRIHAHFIHTPASVVGYAAGLLRITWSCSAHAKDIWTSPDRELRQKLGSAAFTVTCTEAGRAKLQSLAPSGTLVHLVYHGLKLDRFVPLTLPASHRDGRDPSAPVRLLSVGRAVEKKGFDVLLQALAALPNGVAWRWTHIGGGALLPVLKTQAQTLGLNPRIDWLGAQDQDSVLEAYRRSDLFVLPCRVAADGDRDGLPNVLVEAQSQGLACISSDVSGVTELIEPERTGIVVPPDRPEALAGAIENLLGDPVKRRRLGRAGALRVQTAFDARASTLKLLDLFSAHAGKRDV